MPRRPSSADSDSDLAIFDVNSLADALTELSGRVHRGNIRPPLPFIAPYQLASLFLESWPTWELHRTYQVIVGDSWQDFAEHWNGMLWKRNWWETHQHQLWIPTKLANNPIFRESLHNWLCGYTNRAAGHRVQLLSNSLPEDRVTDIQNYFRQHELPLHLDFVSADQIAQRRRRAEEEVGPPTISCLGRLMMTSSVSLDSLTVRGSSFQI